VTISKDAFETNVLEILGPLHGVAALPAVVRES
jgi:hypothetical protein